MKCNLRFYVLTSAHPQTLRRCLRTLPHRRTVVVVNTLDEQYARFVQDYCREYDIDCVRTESDGTPATGKNSMCRVFLESDDEYAVMIDGDDYLTPYGVYFYDWVASLDKVPDLLVTHNEVYTNNGEDTFEFFQNNRDWTLWDGSGKGRYNLMGIAKHQPTQPIEKDIEMVLDAQREQWGEDACIDWAHGWHNFRETMNRYGDTGIIPNRMVFWSRKAAELANYRNDLRIGEDTFQYLTFKQMYGRGEIDICMHNEDPLPTYIYVSDNTREPGISAQACPQGVNWVQDFAYAIEDLMPIEYGVELQPINIKDYK
jgi:hypothetical protein